MTPESYPVSRSDGCFADTIVVTPVESCMSPEKKRALLKDWPLLLSYGSLIAVLTFASGSFTDLTSGTQVGLLFAWLFVVILLAAFSVVHHAECLAQKLGEPYGTLILTLSVIGLEVLMIVTVMITKNENPAMARDTMFGVLMIVLNALLGLSIVVGSIRHKIQEFNFNSSESFLGGIIALVGLGLVLPAFIPAAGAWLFEIYLIVGCLVFYGFFLWVQTKQHSEFFEYRNPDGTSDDHGHPESPFGIGYHVVLLILTLVPLVVLAKQLSVVLDVGLETMGAPEALVGLVVAILILAPEGLAAVAAARYNNLQRALNICLGSGLATIGLTIPTVLVIGLLIGQDITLGLEPIEVVLITITLLVLMVSTTKGKANVFKGIVHLLLFASYCVFIFI